MSINVLVTGGSGFLGINLIRYLLKKDYYKIRSLDLLPFDYPERDRVEVVEGDIRDIDVVDNSVRGMDIAIHTAAALPLYKKEEEKGLIALSLPLFKSCPLKKLCLIIGCCGDIFLRVHNGGIVIIIFI